MLLEAMSLRLPRRDDGSADTAAVTWVGVGVGGASASAPPVDEPEEHDMEIVFECCAGIDVHKRTVVAPIAALIAGMDDGQPAVAAAAATALRQASEPGATGPPHR